MLQDCQDPELRKIYTLKTEVHSTASTIKDTSTEPGLKVEEYAKPEAGASDARFKLHDFHDCGVLHVSQVLQDCACAPPHPEVSADFVTGRGNTKYSHITKEERIRFEYLQARLALSRHQLAEQGEEQVLLGHIYSGTTDTYVVVLRLKVQQARNLPTLTISTPSFSTSFKSSTFREYMLHGSGNCKSSPPVAAPQPLQQREHMYFKV